MTINQGLKALMTIKVVRSKDRPAMVDKKGLFDQRLSWAARGVYAHLSAKEAEPESTYPKKTVAELKRAGYLKGGVL